MYVNKFNDKAHGKLIMTESCLEFKVDKSLELSVQPEMFDVTIDYLDIVSVSRLQIPNEEAIFRDDAYYRKNYTYNYIIQVELSAVNGLSIVNPPKGELKEKGAEVDHDKGIIQRSNVSIVNIFFKVSGGTTC